MTEIDHDEFEKKFHERQRLFLLALDGLMNECTEWQIYLDDQQITDDGEVRVLAVKYGAPSTDFDELGRYCRFITGQGFNLEIAADPQCNLHLMSWEELEPEWPEDLDAVLFLRWNTVDGQL